MLLRTLTAALATLAMPLLMLAPAHAIGRLTDVQIVDRNTGQVLPTYWHSGKWWVAGTPGNRYGIALNNRSNGRVLTVISVDGVNAVSGETASWDQTGYVLTPWRSTQITGWRKSDWRVAAFEFTALENSYAARTGRPDHVGVIGVAVFRERPRPEVVPLSPPPPLSSAPRSSLPSTADSAAAGATAQSQESVPAEADAARPERRLDAARLGTGHGRQETSRVTYTDFERARPSPDEIVTIHYDSRENLVAMGVIPRSSPAPHPRPFPGSPLGYVPDPPQ